MGDHNASKKTINREERERERKIIEECANIKIMKHKFHSTKKKAIEKKGVREMPSRCYEELQ